MPPSEAATSAGLAASAGTKTAVSKQYIRVQKARISNNHRSVSGVIRWHAPTLASKGDNHFSVWAGINRSAEKVISLGWVHYDEKALNARGALRFTLPWGAKKAEKVAKATSIQVSVTQRFNSANKPDKTMEKVMFDSVLVSEDAGPIEPAPMGCDAKSLKPGVHLELCRFAGINFTSGDANHAYLNKALFVDCFMTWAHFEYLRGEFLQVVNSDIGQAKFYLADLSSATFGAHNDYTGTDFRAANLSHATFSDEPASKGRPKTDNRTLCPPKGNPGPCMFDW